MSYEFGRTPDGICRLRDEDGTVGEPGEVIFPIFVKESERKLRAVGTGFYIGGGGLFATAAHVLNESLDDRGNFTTGMWILHRFSNKIYWRPIIQTTTHPLTDVAIGYGSAMKHNITGELLGNKVVALSAFMPLPFENISTFAYPETQVTGEPQDIDMYSGWYQGRLLETLPRAGDRVMLPGPCYRTSIVVHGGASGGPVFDRRGKVFAVNSTGFHADTVSYVSCVSSVFDLHVQGIHPDTNVTGSMTVRQLAERKVVFIE